VDRGEKISSFFVVARGDGPKLLELAKEIFSQAASFIEVFVVRARLFAVGLCGNDRFISAWRKGSITRSSYSTASTKSRLSLAVTPTVPSRIPRRMTTRHGSAPPIRPTAYESREAILRNLEGYVKIKPRIDDRP
jgi:hypothetical protein